MFDRIQIKHPFCKFAHNDVFALTRNHFSGGGKSTLLDFITCSIQSNIVANGEVSLPGSLAYVPQDDRLHGFYTTKQYMEHYARLAGIEKSAKRDETIKEIIDSLGLTEQTNTIVGDIVSYGLVWLWFENSWFFQFFCSLMIHC